MSNKHNKLSNSYSSSGGGSYFESYVQAAFVTLMLSGGYSPCLPCWPIKSIKLQGKIDGIETDDIVVIAEKNKVQRKIFGQIKHSISFTKSNINLKEVINSAWIDYNNPKVFCRGKDTITLITGPLNATDISTIQWILNHARHSKGVEDFFIQVKAFNFSPTKCDKKLDALRYHLEIANGNANISDNDFYDFLKHFYLLIFDLDYEGGVVLPLLHSHISQFNQQYPSFVWDKVVNIVQKWNQDSGTITMENLPDELKDIFKQPQVTVIPKDYSYQKSENVIMDLIQHPQATDLALANLIGAWNEKNNVDIEVIEKLITKKYSLWISSLQGVLQLSDSPIVLRNGEWTLNRRNEVLSQVGTRIFDQDLDTYQTIAVTVLKEIDPSLELPPDDRLTAKIQGKVFTNSQALRNGLANGLAMIGNQSKEFSNCSDRKAESTAILSLREILSDANWLLWGSLNDLLPILAEAAPKEFMDAVERSLQVSPCPFDILFTLESNGIMGTNYLTGLLWSLECLAWDEKDLIRVCVILGELASHDPGGKWDNRPQNSLETIFLPWLPQTIASVDKRIVAVKTLCREWPDSGWNLVTQLLPNRHLISSGSYKPTWRNTIPVDWENKVSIPDYWRQIDVFADLAITLAGLSVTKLADLIDHLDDLPQNAFEKMLQILESESILALSEEKRLILWDHLAKFSIKHRKFAGAEWAIDEKKLSVIEIVEDRLSPTNPFILYQPLFSNRDYDLYEDNENFEFQKSRIQMRRQNAIEEIIKTGGLTVIEKFARLVESPSYVGDALGYISDFSIDESILQLFLVSENIVHLSIMKGFIYRKHQINGWTWSDSFDKTRWSREQIVQFLGLLPFENETWKRASLWLCEYEGEYWEITHVNAFESNGQLEKAISKLIEFGRPCAAISCFDYLRHEKQKIDTALCVRALSNALTTKESTHSLDAYQIVELIKLLQVTPDASEDDLFSIEWSYLSILDRHQGASPKTIEFRLSSNAQFFCEVIQLIFRSSKVDMQRPQIDEKRKAIATNAWRLLSEWRTLPGIQKDGSFREALFISWLEQVKLKCEESGHLEIALTKIGEVLIYSPADASGLWINKTIAEAMNNKAAAKIRNGYRIGLYNSRGVHSIDPNGIPEKKLAEQYQEKADSIENAGFHRIAATLRGISEEYNREAEQIIRDNLNNIET